MEFPYGHHTHHHHHQRNDDDDQQEERPQHYPPPGTGPPPPFNRPPPQGPPPPYYQENEFAPPPPPYFKEHEFQPPPPPYFQEHEFQPPPPPPTQVSHVYHHTTQNQQELDYPPPPQTQVTHVSHEQKTETHHPHLPSFLQHHSHEASSGSGLDLSKKPTYKVFCKAKPDFHMTIKDGKVVLAPSDPSDEYQNWYKDEKYSTTVKDEVGFPSFALVNKACGQAMKHSIGAAHPVQLIPYNPDVLDESVLWSESKELDDGYRAVRMVNNIRLNWDAFHGDKKSGGVHTGTTIVLYEWHKGGDNQRWKITPHCKFLKKGHEISTKVFVVIILFLF